MSHEKRVTKVYYREMAVALAVYVALLLASIRFGRPLPDGTLRTCVLASPMAGFGLMIWAIARHLRRIDEYMRQQLLETVSIAAAITAGLTFTYGFLESAGFPRLSMFSVWCVMAGTAGAVQLARRLVNR